MSHEIRTPMNAIIGMSELLATSELDAEQAEYISIVCEASRALLSIIEDVLDISRIEEGRIKLVAVPFGLRALIKGTCKLLSERALQRRLEMRVDIASAVPDTLVGDPERLRQVLVNLLGNAIKFTEIGHVALAVEIDAVDDRGAAGDREYILRFCVSDTGVGIPDDKQKMVFSAFEQADTSASRRFGGTGLGLAIASDLVTLMGGRIWMESTVGRGSQFFFTARFGGGAGELSDYAASAGDTTSAVATDARAP